MKTAESILASVVKKNARGNRIFQIVVAVISFGAGIGTTFLIQAVTSA
jgi:hypothetical protein